MFPHLLPAVSGAVPGAPREDHLPHLPHRLPARRGRRRRPPARLRRVRGPGNPRKNILHTVRNTAVAMSGHRAGGRLLHRLQVPRVQRRGAVLRLLKLSVRQLRHGSPGE